MRLNFTVATNFLTAVSRGASIIFELERCAFSGFGDGVPQAYLHGPRVNNVGALRNSAFLREFV